MKKWLVMFVMLVTLLTISGCNTNSVKKIKADTIDIGYGQSLYSGSTKIDLETVQSLVDSYNEIEYIGQTSEEINYEKAISITFIHNDMISGVLVIDDNGVCHVKGGQDNYTIDPSNKIYTQAKEVFTQLKAES